MSNQKKIHLEIPLSGSMEVINSEEEQLVRDAIQRASLKFIEELKKAGLEPLEGGDEYDRGHTGHDRSA